MEQFIIKNSNFADFEQVKNILLTLNRSKKLTAKFLCEKLNTYTFFLFRPLPRVTGTPPWLLRPMRVSTSSELYPDTRLFLFFECIGIQFFNSLTCDLREAMPCQRSLTLTHMTYRIPCHARGHSHSYLRKWRISPGVISILGM